MRNGLVAALAIAGLPLMASARQAPAEQEQGLRQEVVQLRQQVRTLQQELAQLEQQLRQAPQPGQPALGGAGAAGMGLPAEPRAPVIATTQFTGRVQSVLPDEIVVTAPDGSLYELRVTQQTEASANGQPLSIQAIPEGATVRTTFELISGDLYASELTVLPQAEVEIDAADRGEQQPGEVDLQRRTNPGAGL